MTKKQRARVVELLRCAADLGIVGDIPCPLTEAAHELGLVRWVGVITYERTEEVRLADRAIAEVREVTEETPGSWRGFGLRCLEAAQRVAAEEWP